MEKTITLGGNEYKVAPLRSLQVADFYDAIENADSQSKVTTVTRSLRVIAQSLRNAKDEAFVPLTEDQAIVKIDEISAFLEIDPAFGVVLDITGLRKSAPGEATAVVESTSSESSTASSAL